jgi:hypothetical protein
MYVHTHVFFLNKKEIKSSPLAIVGSFIPDIALMGIIGWDDLHKKDIIEKFQVFINETQPELGDLGKGTMCHFMVDEITHKHYKDDIGYAYKIITPALIKLTSQSFQIKDDKAAKGIAHNAIELAVNSFMLENNPEIIGEVKDAIGAVDNEIIANILSLFFKLNKEKVTSALKNYFSLVTKYDTRNAKDYVELCNDTNMLIFNKTVNKDKTRKLMLYSRDLVKDSYQEFLDTSTSVSPSN